MAGNRKRNPRAYLDAFEKDSEGKYFYAGEFYELQGGEEERRRKVRRLWALAVSLLAASAASCCVTAPGTADCAYVLLPSVAAFLGGVSVFWGMCRLGAGAGPVRAYAYQASVGQLPFRASCAAIGAGAAIAGELAYVLQSGPRDGAAGAGLFLMLEGAALAAAVGIRRQIKKMVWKVMEKTKI